VHGWGGSEDIGVARGALSARAPPGRRKKIKAKFTGKSCKCAPGRACTPMQSISAFLGNWKLWTVGVVNLVVLACFEGDD